MTDLNNYIHKAILRDEPKSRILGLIERHYTNCREKGKDDKLPLFLAVECKTSEEIVAVLIASYPQACGIKSCGVLPIHVAASSHESFGVFDLLLKENPESLNVFDDVAGTLLHCAALNRSTAMLLKVLKLFPAAASIRNKQGALPLHLHILGDRATVESVIALIEIDPSSLEVRDNIGYIPLHYAVKYCSSLNVIDILLQNTKDGCKIRTSGGYLPLSLAAFNEHITPELILKVYRQYPEACREATAADHCLPIHSLLAAVQQRQLDASKYLPCFKLYLESYPQSVLVKYKQHRPLDTYVCKYETLLRMMYNVCPNDLHDTDAKRYRDMNWSHRRLAIRLHYSILQGESPILYDGISQLNVILTKLVCETGYGRESISVPNGILQYIILYL